MSNLYTGALPLSAIRAAQAQRAAQDAPDKTAYTASAQDNGTAQNIKTLPQPVQERRFGTPTPAEGVERPRVFTGRQSGPRTASIQRLYTIPEFMRTAAESWRECGNEGTTGCTMRQAASVIFVRDGDNGLETILTYRPGTSPLGVVAFPGGTALPGDDESASWVGPGADYWQEQFHFSDIAQARRSVMAAVRESFEETGILLAGEDEQDVVERSSTPELMAWREAVAEQDKSFSDFLTSSGLSVRADLLRPVARWQSPDFFLKRYDIAYFTTALPVGQDPKLLLGKGVWGDWLNVRELLEAKDTSELGDRIGQPNTVGRTLDQLITPGVMCMLESLAKAQTSVAWLSKRRKIEVKKPVLVTHNGACMLSFTEVVPATTGSIYTGAMGAL
ncbi:MULTISPECIES: NUDIX hydrolase [Rothia]|jgi:NTP pyrophosphohydrolase including oxidative damage repair enzyme|uniref:NUDIX hydrolase n=1 Tax=Rothia TaxID=32207 RepID=UPI00066CFA7C|nr:MULTISPECIES: NUDIX hydrolase [Rothia]OFL76160.1 NUDIX hydrolase [Rothia sp. HMSC075F09]OFQ75838.1 NUDIX hydrolase [Rothia sp. HMSC068E02]OFR60064.1 NUDIX hydrolase [Rothia sp. HMSC069C04]